MLADPVQRLEGTSELADCGVLLFLPASLLVLLTAELGYESPGRLLRNWYTKLRRAGAVDEPRRDSYVASELREAVKELQAVKEQRDIVFDSTLSWLPFAIQARAKPTF